MRLRASPGRRRLLAAPERAAAAAAVGLLGPAREIANVVTGELVAEIDDLVAEQGGLFECELAGGLLHPPLEVFDQTGGLVAGGACGAATYSAGSSAACRT